MGGGCGDKKEFDAEEADDASAAAAAAAVAAAAAAAATRQEPVCGIPVCGIPVCRASRGVSFRAVDGTPVLLVLLIVVVVAMVAKFVCVDAPTGDLDGCVVPGAAVGDRTSGMVEDGGMAMYTVPGPFPPPPPPPWSIHVNPHTRLRPRLPRTKVSPSVQDVEQEEERADAAA